MKKLLNISLVLSLLMGAELLTSCAASAQTVVVRRRPRPARVVVVQPAPVVVRPRTVVVAPAHYRAARPVRYVRVR